MKKIFLSTILSLAAATVFASTQTKATEDKPWRVYMLGGTMNTSDSDHSIENDYYYPYPQPTLLFTSDNQTTSEKNVDWINGLGGGGSGAVLNNSTFEDFYYAPAYTYTDYGNSSENDSINLDGSGVGNEYQAYHNWGSYWGWEGWNWENFAYNSSSSLNLDVTISSYLGNEHCDVTDSAHPPLWTYFELTSNLGLVLRQITQTETYQRYAQAVWHVQNGGKAMPGRRSLWQFSGSATEIRNLRAWPPDYAYGNALAIPNTQVVINGVGTLRTDGTCWTTLPDGQDLDITPTVAGKDFYTFGVGGQKYPLTILANGNDLSVTNPEFSVGQQVYFTFDGLPLGNIVNMVGQWSLPGKFVNQPTNYSSTCPTYVRNDDLLQNTNQTSCWFVNEPGGTVIVGMSLKFDNGQTASVSADGKISVYRPQVNSVVPNGPFGAGLDAGLLGGSLSLMNGPMNFAVTINSKYSGNFGLTQLVNYFAETIVLPPDVFVYHTTYGSFWLDGPEYYDGPVAKDQTYRIYDAPTLPLILFFGSYNGNWQDYVRFTPDGGIPVTLGRIDWDWSATCENPGTGWYITSDGVDGPTLHDDDSFPLWSHVKPAPED